MVAPAATGRLGEALGEDRCVESIIVVGAHFAFTFLREVVEARLKVAEVLPVGPVGHHEGTVVAEIRIEAVLAKVRSTIRIGSAIWVSILTSLPSWKGLATISATLRGLWPECRRRCIRSTNTLVQPRANTLRNG